MLRSFYKTKHIIVMTNDIKYPPYVNAYKLISELLNKIKTASVPPKFTYDFLRDVLGLKSSSYRAMIPLLKRLNFLDGSSVPTERYKSYRDITKSKQIMAEAVRESYDTLYRTAEYAHKLEKKDITTKLKTVLGVGDDDTNVPNVVGTFMELVKNSDFDSKSTKAYKEESADEADKMKIDPENKHIKGLGLAKQLGISYTINLNLPATTEIEVYNAIFKALRENIINE